jgi:hypothetical protein
MGRKGDSKRKTSKPKTPTAASGGGNGAVSALAHVPESAGPKLVGKGEAISTGKGGKKKK